jgi:hypothetical protein
MRTNCTKCGEKIDIFDIGKKGAYYNKNNELVCFKCFKEEEND